MLLDRNACALVIVDVQTRLMPAIGQGERVVSQCVRLASIARLLGVPVVGTEQSPRSLGDTVAALKPLCAHTVVKHHFDACADGLLQALPVQCAQRTQLVLAGCEAHVCLLQTALGLLAHGFSVWVVSDAVGSRHASDREAALARLAAAGARLVTLEMVAFEWLRHSEDPAFRDVLRWVK